MQRQTSHGFLYHGWTNRVVILTSKCSSIRAVGNRSGFRSHDSSLSRYIISIFVGTTSYIYTKHIDVRSNIIRQSCRHKHEIIKQSTLEKESCENHLM